MKICPHCQTTYSDDDLRFCLQDGTPLANFAPSQTPTANWAESETLVSPSPRVNTQNSQSGEATRIQTSHPEPKKSNAFKIILLTMFGMFLLFTVGGIGAWIIWKNSQGEREITANTNVKPTNIRPQSSPNTNQNANAVVNIQSNANVNSNVAPTITPTPKPTSRPEETAQAEEDIANVIDGWNSALENLNLNSHMSNYAETVDYYRGGKVSVGTVRADKQRAYDIYDSINIDISNVKFTPDETGEKATVVFDKEWVFENYEKTSSGKVQQQLQFVKAGGKWKISGERDLKVYYIEK